MYSSYRNYYRSKYGFSEPPNRRANRALARVRWRYNQPRPVYELSYFDFDLNDLFESEDPTNTVEETSSDVLRFKVLDVNLKKQANRLDHNTELYEDESLLIVRRGQEFKLSVKVDKKFEKDEDVIKLRFSMGNKPMESKGTKFIIKPGETIDPLEPSAVIDNVSSDDSGSEIDLRVCLPSDSVIGRFQLAIRLRNKGDAGNDRRHSTHKVEEKIVVLFNPWCKDDTVYMEDADLINEYVKNQFGAIYYGSSRSVKPRKWNFGQFDKVALEAALYILDNSQLSWEGYGNPVKVSRTISAMVNSNSGDGGILAGNWSGNYSGGVAPTKWTGSIKILEKYMETKQEVEYGQCWVFSGLCTTIGRALGIPTRSVTNFDSAHDTDSSMTIDYHQDTNGEPLKQFNDSVWNYHVWNEGWFKRPDLPDGYDGWQAFDATPQEISDGEMCCGPAPLAAIKAGDVHLGYDTKFIFGEVNGDRVYWEVYNPLGEKRVIRVSTDSVGAMISTKAPNVMERLDVTDLYKHAEGSEKERSVVKKVVQQSSQRKALEEFYKIEDSHDVQMEFQGDMSAQGDASFSFKLQNTSSENRTVMGRFHLMATYYTGVEGDDIDDEKKTFNLEPGKEEQFSWTVKAADWLNKVDEDATLGVYVTAKVKETNQNFIYKEAYEIDKPELQMSVSKPSMKVCEETEVTVEFTNPLQIPLTDASFMLEGGGIKGSQEIEIKGEIAPGAKVTEKLTSTPKMPGNKEIIASFHSRQLVNISGSVSFKVSPKDEGA